MDTSWCPVCDRLIPPNRQQILPAVLPQPEVVQVPVESKLPRSKSGSNVAKALNRTHALRKTESHGPKAKRSAANATFKVPQSPASAAPTSPTKPAPKPRTVLTQEPSLYCSERCMAQDLANSLTLSPLMAPSLAPTTPPLSPLFVSGSESDPDVDSDRANYDYFESMRQQYGYPGKAAGSSKYTTPAATNSSTESMTSLWDWSHGSAASRTSKRTSPERASTSRTAAYPTMTPISRPMNSSSSRAPSTHRGSYTTSYYAPPTSGTSAPSQTTAADLYAAAYPLAFQRSQSSSAIARGPVQHHASRRSKDISYLSGALTPLQTSPEHEATTTTPTQTRRRSSINTDAVDLALTSGGSKHRRSTSRGSGVWSREEKDALSRERTKPEMIKGLLVHVPLPTSSSSYTSPSPIRMAAALASMAPPIKEALPPREEDLPLGIGWSKEKDQYVPTYPLQVIPPQAW